MDEATQEPTVKDPSLCVYPPCGEVAVGTLCTIHQEAMEFIVWGYSVVKIQGVPVGALLTVVANSIAAQQEAQKRGRLLLPKGR